MKSEGKPKLSLVPKSAIWGAAEALTYGMQKHGKYSFKENGFPYTDLADKVLRHMTEWLDGNDFDKETGFHQLHHAIADLAILIDVVHNNPQQDDRFHRSISDDGFTEIDETLVDMQLYPEDYIEDDHRSGFGAFDNDYYPNSIDTNELLKNIDGSNKNDNSKR